MLDGALQRFNAFREALAKARNKFAVCVRIAAVPVARFRYGRQEAAVQSFDDASLEAIGRVHGADEARRALACALEIFPKVNADLMYALPGQSVALDIELSAPLDPGRYTVKIDLVDQHVCWFEERGSQPLVFSFAVEG